MKDIRPICCTYLLILGLLLHGCKPSKPELHPVDRVIGSMSDSLPQVQIPEGEDPQHENWAGADLSSKAPVLPLYPEEEAELFELPEGYQMTPILTEPQIEQPGAIAFDGNGRMYVLELRTYMLNADSEGTMNPVSRISRWEDTDNDGVYDKGTVFADSLVFPRFVLPYGKDCILAMESNEDDVYKFIDTDGDGVADRKEHFTNKYGRSGNVEHQQAFMYWGMDNWLYSTVNAFRVRETSAGVIREPTGHNRAQWGITHDDDGKLWFQGGASGLPSYFQFPIHYGNFKVEGEFAEGFDIPWGAPIYIADMQGGMDQVRQPDGSLNRVTGAAGNDIYRGDRLPEALYGQYFYGEPVARIVRQVNPEVREGLTTLHNVYQAQQSEFIKSRDPLFRPVDMTTAPDGTLYITDMYHGIIQEGQWAQKGSYLRTKIEQYQLDKVIQLGRIWRLSHKSKSRDRTKPRMLDQKPAELLQYLSHPNGWWRDKAQQLIVLSKDRSLGPKLEEIARNSENLLARFHALWCLEGLGILKVSLLEELFQDQQARMQIQAMRAGESLLKAGQSNLKDKYLDKMQHSNPEVALQALLSVNYLELESARQRTEQLLKNSTHKGIQLVGKQLLEMQQDQGFGKGKDSDLTGPEIASLERGKTIFDELCAQCHGRNGSGTPLGNGAILAPALTGSYRVQWHPEYVIKTIMHGMQGPLDGKDYPGGIMVGNKEQSDQWIADITSYIRHGLSNEASLVTEDEVVAIRNQTQDKTTPYNYLELTKSVPSELLPNSGWELTASHTSPTRIGGSANPIGAFNFEGWTSGVPQEKEMWYEISLPEVTALRELHFDAPSISRGWRPGSPPPLQTYPAVFEVMGSADGKTWNSLGKIQPENNRIRVVFAETALKKIRLILKEPLEQPEEVPWSMRQLKLYGTK